MRRLVRWLVGLVLVAAVSVGAWCGAGALQRSACASAVEDHLIAKRAAEICTGSLVGCSLTRDEIEAMLRKEVRAMRACR